MENKPVYSSYRVYRPRVCMAATFQRPLLGLGKSGNYYLLNRCDGRDGRARARAPQLRSIFPIHVQSAAAAASAVRLVFALSSRWRLRDCGLHAVPRSRPVARVQARRYQSRVQ